MRAHLAEYLNEIAAARSDGPAGRVPAVRRFAPPSVDELRDTPFEGEGPDPLEEIGR